jgi:hypothetical protein
MTGVYKGKVIFEYGIPSLRTAPFPEGQPRHDVSLQQYHAALRQLLYAVRYPVSRQVGDLPG